MKAKAKAPVKKASSKKVAPKKAVKKAPVKKVAPKKVAKKVVKKVPIKKVAPKKVAKKVVKKAVVKKAVVKKEVPKKVVKKVKETLTQEGLRLLSSVPSKDWITNEFTDGKSKGCAIGHYMRLKSKNPKNFKYKNCSDLIENPYDGCKLRQLTIGFIRKTTGEDCCIATVNNTRGVKGYTQDNPKDRVIALLTDMVKKGL